MTNFKTPPPTQIDQPSREIYQSIKNSPLTVLCGRNNSGKSFLLRRLLGELGDKTSYLGPARYANFTVLSPYGPQPTAKFEKWQELLRQFQNSSQNVDNSPLNLQQAIAELSDDQREVLFSLISELLSASAKILHTIPGNSMSQQYIDVDGYNLSFTSSGFRLVITLLTSLLDRDYEWFLIDEPELGLSPEIQGIFADWLLNATKRSEYLRHMRGVVLATHSPVFLDRRIIHNNLVVEKIGADISLRRIQSIQELNALQFELLGNRFETMFLPSAILLVEGKTDHAYLSRLIALRTPNSRVSVINATSDGRMREIIAIARQMLGDIPRSPYAKRIFVVLDSRHGTGLSEHIRQMGIPEQNIIIWDNNGIEYVYPHSILSANFGPFDSIQIVGDIVTINGHSLTKQQLAEYVLNSIKGNEELPQELLEKLLNPLEKLLY